MHKPFWIALALGLPLAVVVVINSTNQSEAPKPAAISPAPIVKAQPKAEEVTQVASPGKAVLAVKPIKSPWAKDQTSPGKAVLDTSKPEPVIAAITPKQIEKPAAVVKLPESVKVPEVKTPAVVVKTPEVKKPVVVVKKAEVKKPVVVAKKPEAKKPVVVVKKPEIKKPVVVVKKAEVKKPVVVAKTPEIKMPIPAIVKAPEAKEQVVAMKAPETKSVKAIESPWANNTPAAPEAVAAEKTPAPVAKTKMVRPVQTANMEGAGGGWLTSSAYLLGTTVEDPDNGPLVASARLFTVGGKQAAVLSATKTVSGFELGYALLWTNLDSMNSAVTTKAKTSLGANYSGTHTFSVRYGLMQETETHPAITAGVQVKYNMGRKRLKKVLTGFGYDASWGMDFSLTASKTWLVANRPLSVSGGLRVSNSADLGIFGFDKAYHLGAELGVSYEVCDGLTVGYEYRFKPDSYKKMSGVFETTESWHALTATYRANDNCNLTIGYGNFGTFGNSDAACAWMLQGHWAF